MPRLVFIILLSFFYSKQLTSQLNENVLINYTQKDGLPSNETYCIFRDSKNYLWIGTDQGVVRYNGNKMEKFELPDNVVFKIREDDRGKIWFFTRTLKLAYFYNEKIYTFKYNDIIADSFKQIGVIDAVFSKNDEIIITASECNATININTGKISKSNNYSQYAKSNFWECEISKLKYVKPFALELNGKGALIDTIKIINEEKESILLRCKMQNHFTHYGYQTNSNTGYLFFGKSLIKLDKINIVKNHSYRIISMFVDEKENSVWIGFFNHGAVKLDGNTLAEISAVKAIGNESVSSIIKDMEGNLWFTTLDNGVYYQKANVKKTILSQQLNYLPIFTLNENNNNLIFSNTNGVYQLVNNLPKLVFEVKSKLIRSILITGKNEIIAVGNLSEKSNEMFFKKKIANGFKYSAAYVIESDGLIIKSNTLKYNITVLGKLIECNI